MDTDEELGMNQKNTRKKSNEDWGSIRWRLGAMMLGLGRNRWRRKITRWKLERFQMETGEVSG